MATESTSSDSTTDQTETVDQKADQSTETPPVDASADQDLTSTGTQDTSQETAKDDAQDDASKKALLADLYKERDSRKALQAQVEKLTADVTKGTDTEVQLTSVTRKYDRLEEFLLKSGSPLGKALDSKSFAARLFDSEDDVADLVKSWNKDNPSITQIALGSGAGAASSGKPSMNDLLRQATK